MLVIEQYGVKLKRITEHDIEQVRVWRNQSEVANYMEYRNYITPEMQKEWFKKVNNKHNYYFIIEFEGKDVGVINAKNYSREVGFGEGGIFIGDNDYTHSFAAVFASLCLLNFFFFSIKLCEKSRARILRTNKSAIHYNLLIGYKLLPNQENEYNQLYELTLDDYAKYGNKLNRAATILSDGNSELTFDGTVCEENGEEINKLLLKRL